MSVQQLIGATLAFSPAANWQSVLRAGQSRDDSDNFRNGIYKSRFNTRRESASWQNDLKLAEHHQLVAGIDWQRDRVDSTTRYAVMSRDDTGCSRNTSRSSANIAAARRAQRRQRPVRPQEHRKHRLGPRAGRGSARHGVLGAAFKAPTFNQLYYPGFGNAGLRPETSRGIDLGLAGKTSSGRWSLNAYATRVADLIGFDAAYNPVAFGMPNCAASNWPRRSGLPSGRSPATSTSAIRAIRRATPTTTSGCRAAPAMRRPSRLTANSAHGAGAPRCAAKAIASTTSPTRPAWAATPPRTCARNTG